MDVKFNTIKNTHFFIINDFEKTPEATNYWIHANNDHEENNFTAFLKMIPNWSDWRVGDNIYLDCLESNRFGFERDFEIDFNCGLLKIESRTFQYIADDCNSIDMYLCYNILIL